MSITMHQNRAHYLCGWTAKDVVAAIRKYRMTHVRLLQAGIPKARVFQKYGAPEKVAASIANGAKNIFFQNTKMVMTQDYVLMPENPETFLMLKDILLAYSFVSRDQEYLYVKDRWGDAYRYPFSAGQKQVFRIAILLDKIEHSAPECRIGNTPENNAYAKQKAIPLRNGYIR